ncbi:hypothetical protein SAMN04489844_1457 [Nocardioides exalbidus]|uniref:Uncharacterized protein n=1 Tax=Nocardioides exalbidus TaxID=402596 RepID=A0A1H4NU98_9ACTN|nr:hypothetical protein [Nocardioides exalbidus]SEB98776.1 hypothetical protein SAMN04489844_1457 [Nocardioides exalbidus]
MKNRPAQLIAASLMALTLLSGCGGGDGGGRPSVEELSGAMQEEGNVLNAGLTAEQSDCFAQALIDSDVSDETLQAIVDNDEDYKGNDADEEAMQSMSTDGLAECMAG